MICQKIIYSKSQAYVNVKLAKYKRSIGDNTLRFKRYYYCCDCKGWHITSMSSKKYKSINKHEIYRKRENKDSK